MINELESIYSGRFAGREAQRSQVWEVLAEYFQKWIKPTDTVIDIGAGYCEFINHIKAARKYALDANPVTAAKAGPGVLAVTLDLKKPWPVARESVNVAFSSNFFEHLPTKDDLRHCLEEIQRILVPEGLLICMGPNIRYAYREYWDFFDHYLPLSDRSLLEACELIGFKQECAIPRFLPFTMQHTRLPKATFLIRAYLAVPFTWTLLGKQFLIIVRKV